MASKAYQKIGELMGTGALDFATDRIDLLIVDDTYDINTGFEADAFVSDVAGDEIPGSTRITNVGTKLWQYNAAQDRWEFTHAAGDFGSPVAGPTIGGVILFKFITNDAASPLLFFDDLSANKPTTGDQVDYTPDPTGHKLRIL